MSTTSLTIWFNADLGEAAGRELAEGVRPHRLVVAGKPAGNLGAGGADAELARADVAFGQPDVKQVMELPKLRWVHLSSAGYTRFDRADVRQAMLARGAALTNSSSVYDEPCAEHILAFMMSSARQLPMGFANQAGPRGWGSREMRGKSRLMVGQSVLILSFGAIARRLVELLAPMRMNVQAVRRTVRGDEPIPVHPMAEMDRLLPQADHVVNILPANEGTERLFSTRHFAMMKPGAIFYNIGRGTTVDQEAMLAALNSGKLAGAYLDVTDPEPLPPEHPLWRAPNCWITPHTAGGHHDEFSRLARHFLGNLARFSDGAPLLDRVI